MLLCARLQCFLESSPCIERVYTRGPSPNAGSLDTTLRGRCGMGRPLVTFLFLVRAETTGYSGKVKALHIGI